MKNIKSLQHLSKNPFYKLTDEEEEALRQFEYGEIETHDNTIPVHSVILRKRKRRGKK